MRMRSGVAIGAVLAASLSMAGCNLEEQLRLSHLGPGNNLQRQHAPLDPAQREAFRQRVAHQAWPGGDGFAGSQAAIQYAGPNVRPPENPSEVDSSDGNY